MIELLIKLITTRRLATEQWTTRLGSTRFDSNRPGLAHERRDTHTLLFFVVIIVVLLGLLLLLLLIAAAAAAAAFVVVMGQQQ